MKKFLQMNLVANPFNSKNFTINKNTFLYCIILFVSSSSLWAQNTYDGYYRVENSNVIFRNCQDEASAIKLDKLFKTLEGLRNALSLIPSDPTILSKIKTLETDSGKTPIAHAPIGTIVEFRKEVVGTDFYEVAVTSKMPDDNYPITSNHIDIVRKSHTYYVSKHDVENNFDLQEKLFLGVITMPFIYKFNDNKINTFNTVAANFKYKFRVNTDNYLSVGAIVGGSAFSKSMEKSDSTLSSSNDLYLMLGLGVSSETLKSINVGVYGGYALGGLNPGAWISAILGIDLVRIK